MGFHIRILAGMLDRTAGSHIYNRELICRLAHRGHRVSVVCFDAVPAVRQCAEVFEIPRELRFSSARFVWRITSLREYLRYGRRLANLNLPPADVVIAAEHLFLKMHARLFPQTPWIYLPHSLVVPYEIESYALPPSMSWISRSLYQHLQHWAINHADRTLRFTDYACQALIKHYGSSIIPRFTINPMGMDLPELYERAAPVDHVKIIWVGQLIPRKRIDIALAALAGLRQYKWRFDIVGDGESRAALERKTQELGLTDRVQFHGFQSDPMSWYRQADLLLFPSWFENSPLTMLESMSYGVPCLAMRSDGVRFHNANSEIIQHGIDGFLAESDDDFSLQLEKILRQPEILAKVGLSARQTIARQHSWDKHLDHYELLFDKLVFDRRRKLYSSRPIENESSRARLRVLYLINSSEIGGGNQSLLTLWKALKPRSVAPTVVCPAEGPMVVACRELGIPCEVLDYWQPTWTHPLLSRRSYRQWQDLISAFRIDLVHTNDLFGARCITLARWRLSLPLVCHVRFPPDPELAKWVFRGLPKPDFFLFVSRALQEQARPDLVQACARSKQQVIYNGVDLENYKPRPKPVGEPLRVGILANLAPIKGHDDFFAMAHKVIAAGHSCEFWVIGEDISHTGYQDHLVQLAAKMGLNQWIKFLGYRHDVADVLNQLDILVCCSHYESLPRCLIEAMACGRPVVATAVGGMLEVVDDGKTGILVGPRDPAALARAVGRLLQNENLRRQMGEAGRARVEAVFSDESHAKQVMKIYETLVSSRE